MGECRVQHLQCFIHTAAEHEELNGECRVSIYLECFIHTAAEHEELNGECRVPIYLECFVHTAAEHEELNGGGEIVEPLEKLGHHLGSVMAGARKNKINK